MAKLKKISKNIKCKGIRNSKNLNSYPSRHIFSPCYTYFISFTRVVIGENSGAAEPSRNEKAKRNKICDGKKKLKNCGRGCNCNYGKQIKKAIKKSQVIRAVRMSTQNEIHKKNEVRCMKSTNQVAQRLSV